MSRLADQQTALLGALFSRPQAHASCCGSETSDSPFVGERGLRAYRANAIVLARRTLRAAFPVVAQLVGDADFDHLAVDFWLTHAPQRGDLAQWGDALPDFLRGNLQLSDEPYLGDVAAVEWALHCAALAADEPADMASFARLSQDDGPEQTLRLASAAVLLCSQFPVASIVMAHLSGQPSLAQAGDLLHDGAAENVLVWRQGMRPRLRACDAKETALIATFVRGTRLDAALQSVTGLDFGAWLRQAVLDGLVIGVQAAVKPA